MELIKKYRLIIAGILILIGLIILRNTGTGHFRYDAKRWAEPSFSGTNIIDKNGLDSLPGAELLVFLTPDTISDLSFEGPSLSIASDSIITRKYRKLLKDHNGSLILISSDISVSARVWMLLSQSGYRNIFIFDPAKDEEPVNEKFRTDPQANPES